MQNIKQELNAKPVGATSSRPHFGEMTLKKQEGITLIALIITIIVMLILVGVTINVALNGGLFEKAEIATRQTQKEVDKEALLAAVVGATKRDGTVDFEILDENLPTKEWSGEAGTYTSPKGNTFTVDANGKITEGGTGSGGENEETPGEEDTTGLILPEGLTVGSEFTMDADQDGTEETWIVLYDGTASHLNENEIEVISKNTMGEALVLGTGDTEAIANATDIDENGKVEDIEIAIYSYNNAIDRINNYCNSLIKIGNLGVRSVGSLPSNPSYRNTSKPYAIQNLEKWYEKTAWNTYGIFGEDTDTNSDDDYNQMDKLGIKKSGDSYSYWLASRRVDEIFMSEKMASVHFPVLRVDSGRIALEDLWYVYAETFWLGFDPSYPVRPVVKLQYP